MIFAGLAWL